jgi:predicted Zn-dependent protease
MDGKAHSAALVFDGYTLLPVDCVPVPAARMESLMLREKFKRTFELAVLLVVVVTLAGGAMLAGLQAISAQPVMQSASQLLGGGGYASGGFAQRAQSGDYLADIGAEGYHRWPSYKFPLKVYIEQGSHVPGYRPVFRQFMVDSFNEWSRVSGGTINWQQVNSPRGADIIAGWTNDVTARGGGVEAGRTTTITKVDPRTGNGIIQSARISILTQLGRRPFSDNDSHKTILHEVGHALGLQGHSRTPSDIMYASVNPAQVPYLKERDVNTLSRLYQGATDSIAALPSRLSQLQRGFVPQSNAGYSRGYGYRQPSYNGYGQPYGYVGNRSPLRDMAWQFAGNLVRRAGNRW